jgi:hypothetical protein
MVYEKGFKMHIRIKCIFDTRKFNRLCRRNFGQPNLNENFVQFKLDINDFSKDIRKACTKRF